jgi:putative polyhydroxyalkanoate system protein
MKNLTVSIPHRLTRAEVKQRIRDEVAKLRREHAALLTELRDTWTGDRMDFFVSAVGQSITGFLVVEDQAVQVEVELPWMLALLAGTVKERVEQQGRRLLAGPRPT